MKLLASVLLAAGCLLAVPFAASAAVYTVDSIGDQTDETGDGVCKTSFNTCTLRAAIEESNKSTGVSDEIKFAASFNGQLADTIAIATSLPAIKDPAHVDGDSGGQCATEAGVNGPCVGVNGPAAGSALTVEDTNGVEIEGLAITGAAGGGGAAAINAINSSATLKVRDNWIGVKLDGSTGANTKGIFLDPESNSATIGGVNAADATSSPTTPSRVSTSKGPATRTSSATTSASNPMAPRRRPTARTSRSPTRSPSKRTATKSARRSKARR